jgi:CheY-like chemotaxis protein
MSPIVGSRRILLVEDLKTLRNLMAIYLGHRGYNVLEAATGAAAIETAIAKDPRLVLLDLRLPDMRGIEVARALRRMPQTAAIPIVGWTAYPVSEPHRQRLLRAGFVECLQKTVHPRAVEAVIERFVPKSP